METGLGEGVATEPTPATPADNAGETGSLGSQEQSIGDPATNRERAPNASENAGSPANTDGEAAQEPKQEPKEPQQEEPQGDLMSDEEDAADKKPDGNGVLGAPEDGYKFEHVEEGAQIDDQTLSEFGDVAKELNLSQEAAQKIVSKLEPMLQRSLERNRKTWADQTRKDPELGGANLQANLNAATRAYKQTTTPEFRALLKAAGLVNHPEFVRHFYHLSKRLSDGAFVTGNAGMSERSAQTVFYKGMNP